MFLSLSSYSYFTMDTLMYILFQYLTMVNYQETLQITNKIWRFIL